MAITPTDYSFSQLITGTDPSATNSGQVLVIDENSLDPDFFNHVQNGGGDIRVCEDSDGTNQIPLHVIFCDTGSAAVSLATRKPTYATLNRGVYVFCGTATTDTKAGDATTYGRNNVYQDDLNTYQFSDNTGISSTGNDDLTLSAGTSTTVSGAHGDAQDLSSARYDGDAALWNTANKSLSLWVKPDQNTSGQYVSSLGQGSTGNYSAIIIGYQSGNFNIFDGGYPTGTASHTQIPATVGEWQKITFTTNGSTLKGFKNGVEVFSRSADLRDVASASRSISIGSSYNGSDFFNGALQLYRQSGEYRTASQELTEYDNQSNPGAFWTQSTPTNPSGGGSGTSYTLTLENAEQLNESSLLSFDQIQAVTLEQSEQINGSQSVDITGSLSVTLESVEQANQTNTLTLDQVIGQTLTLETTQQANETNTLSVSQQQAIDALLGEQLNEISLTDVVSAQAIILAAVEQSNESTTIDINQSDGQLIALIQAEQLNETSTLFVTQLGAIEILTGEQLNESSVINISESLSLESIAAEQINQTNLLNILTSGDNTDLSGLKLVPVTTVFTLTETKSKYTLTEQ